MDELSREEINTGMIVTLKSGGPDMTIVAYREDDVWCYWFTEDNKLQEGKFHYAMLLVV